jgi:hypothetical protein
MKVAIRTQLTPDRTPAPAVSYLYIFRLIYKLYRDI